MKKIIALGGSNSKNSINKTFATFAARQISNAEITVVDLNEYELPLYGIDTENEKGIPENAKKVNSLIETADGLVLSLAEHNGSYTVAFKNVFDWLSRIHKDVWKNKPMLLMAASPGGRGGASVLNTARISFPHLGGNLVAEFSLPRYYDNFSEKGLKDEVLNEQLMAEIKKLEKAISS